MFDPNIDSQIEPQVQLADQPIDSGANQPISSPVWTGIPTSDPQAALQFCRDLATALASLTPTVADPRAEPGIKSDLSWKEPGRPSLSVVIPVFNEQENLQVLHTRLAAALGGCEPNCEIIFVDDGSRDSSPAIERQLTVDDPRVVVIQLARNFGHQVAISAGLDHARGQAVIVMDADLQDPPEVLPEFIAKWREGHDVVYAVREHRKESWLKRMAYSAFYRLLQHVANINIPLDSGDFCIMDRRVVDLLTRMPERSRFVRGIRSWIGLDQVGLSYERSARYAGHPKYTMTRLIYLALDGLVSFSFVPLRMISVLGLVVSLLSILLAMIYTIQKLTMGLSPPGFATTIVAIFFLAGIQLITMGVIGEYVGRIFEEVKRRPLYVIRQVIKKEQG
ncbi:MAG: glycosyltransferase family 2 protein [Anaerolineae bacterium]